MKMLLPYTTGEVSEGADRFALKRAWHCSGSQKKKQLKAGDAFNDMPCTETGGDD